MGSIGEMIHWYTLTGNIAISIKIFLTTVPEDKVTKILENDQS